MSAAALDFSKKRIRQIEHRALIKLKEAVVKRVADPSDLLAGM